MKKTVKIGIICLLALTLLLSAAVLTVSASTDTDAPFLIDGVGYGTAGTTTLAEAISAANGKTVTLNSDVTVSETVSITASTKLDLGERSVTSSAATLFSVADNVSFELVGKGSITAPGNVISAGTDSTVTLNGDISVKLTASGSRTNTTPRTYTYVDVFSLGSCAKTTVNGKLTVTPEGHTTRVFVIGNSATTKAAASVLEISGATVSVNVPWNNAYVLEDSPGTIVAFLTKGSNMIVDSSDISVKHGSVIKCETDGWGAKPQTADKTVTSTKSFNKWLTVSNSNLTAVEGGYTRLYKYSESAVSRYSYSGTILDTSEENGKSAAIEASFTSSNLYADGLAFYHTYGNAVYTAYSSINLDNVNCYYVNGATNTTAGVSYGYNNIVWDGGIIDYSGRAAYSTICSISITDSDPFGEAAIAALEANSKVLKDSWYVSTTEAEADGVTTYTHKYFSRSDTEPNGLFFGNWSHFTYNENDYGILLRDVYVYQSIGDGVADETPTVAASRTATNDFTRLNNRAVVIWLDYEGNVLDIDKYTADASTVPNDFDGELPAVEGVTITENDWTAISNSPWDKQLSDIDLSTAGFTFITQGTGIEVPEGGVPNIKINVSTYTNHRLNIYVPVYNRPDTVSNVSITSSDGGKLDKLDNVTINGLEYEYYYVILGAADVEIRNFTLSYTSSGAKLSQEIKYGLPYYAAQIMATADGTDNVCKEAKTLVVNMVNYADKVLSVMGADKSSDGAALYTAILKKYGTGTEYSYLTVYEALTDSRFSETGDIYLSEIKNLTYTSNPYLSGASFVFSLDEPVFAVKYSEAASQFSFTNASGAEQVYGILAPNNNTGVLSWKSGILSVIKYYNDSITETNALTYHTAYAKNADGSNGERYTGTDIYGANTDLDAYNYWALAQTRVERTDTSRSLLYVSYPISITVYAYQHKNDTGADKTTYETEKATYSLAAYIKEMIDTENTEFAEAAKSLYAYSKAAMIFSNRTNKIDITTDDLGEPVASTTAETLSSDTELVAINNNVYTNKSLYTYMELDKLEAGDEIYVGHAILPKLNEEGNYVDGAYASSYVLITSTYVQFINYYSETNNSIGVTTSNPLANLDIYYHGLTISDSLEIRIDVEFGIASFKMVTAEGSFEKSGIKWNGRQGNVLVKPVGIELSNVQLNWYCDALSENVWVFGASYLNYTDSSRWPYYMKADGYTDNCLIGYPGMTTTPALKDLKLFVEELGYRPKYIAWTVGMNTPDTLATDEAEGAINAKWLAETEEFVALCKEYGITPVLCTIPNTPTVTNEYKNAWIKASGERYIDMAESVGSNTYDASLIGQETGVTGATKLNSTGYCWSEGMISKDLVHPTAAGAKAMYERIIADFPEIMGVE